MSQPETKQRAVWVVDDSRLDAERARRVLEPLYQVDVFHDGSAALERLAQGATPDVMIVDWLMPGVSGIEVCRFVRAGEPRLRELGVLLLTARRETQQVVEGLGAGANDYVAKPFVDDELLARVAALVRSRALRERAEAAEELARRLLAVATDPLIAVGADGRITFVNEEACRILGQACADLVGREVALVLPGLALNSVSISPGEPLFPLPDLRLGGRVFAPLLRSLPGDDAANTTITLRDVTATRRADAHRTDFYSIMAHDLRSPLSATLLRTDLILRGKHGLLPPRVVEDVRKIDQSLKWLVNMINDFLELARLQGASQRIEREEVDLVVLVDQVMDELMPLLELHRLSWTPVRPSAPATLLGDRRRLRQVITNLVANAIKFTPPNGMITTRVKVGDDVVEATVEDTGRGISREALASIFDRFTREVDPANEVSGTGLGLMIVRDIVQAHGGQVGVESAPGAGSRFWFRLPRPRGRS
jgi:two-component system phosphate regulon sensor histidine kinase PhoR